MICIRNNPNFYPIKMIGNISMRRSNTNILQHREKIDLNVPGAIHTFVGKFSTVQTPSNGLMPADKIKITNDKLVTGIQV